MMKRVTVPHVLAALSAVTVLGAPGIAAAQTAPACSAATNPVYISGSSASKPVLQALQTLLPNITIIYTAPDSCYGLNDQLTKTASTEAGASPLNLQANAACSLDATPQVPDIGVSDVFLQTCEDAGFVMPDSTRKVDEILGPIQAMTIAVPSLSSATAISGEAAYVVFGYDATTYTVPQWNLAADVFVRPASSGTLNMIGKAIGLSPASWANAAISATPPAQQQAGTGNMFKAVAQAPSTNAGIGILSYEAVQQNNATSTTGTVKILPYQPIGQSAAYLPDSDSQHPDRINVRQGNYQIWGPLHFTVTVDANGNPVPGNTATSAADVATVLNYFIETGPTSAMGIHDAEATVTVTPFASSADAGVSISSAETLLTAESTVLTGGVVPWCAMQVARTSEIGAPVSYSQAGSCGCYFEKTATGATRSPYCQACTSDLECQTNTPCTPKCNYGYCEAQ